jgi:putative chitinase
MNADQFARAIGCTPSRALLWLDPMENAMASYAVNTPKRQAAFLAQIGHESDGLFYSEEIWGPTEAQSGYEGRADLGNTQEGDGYTFRGRSPIQITGRANYQKVSDALSHDFVADPDDLATPSWGSMAAAWFWNTHGLNELADADQFTKITQVINGGQNGSADRMSRWIEAKQVLGVS